MTEPRRRRFTLLDAMVLVLATAVGLAWGRPIFEFATQGHPGYTPRTLLFVAAQRGWAWFFAMSPCLAMWTLTLPILAWFGPRPRLRRLARRPGWIACCSASLIMFVMAGFGFVEVAAEGTAWGATPLVIPLWQGPLGPMGCAVAASWSTLALTGQWRPEPTWIDRAGRLLGAIWIGAIPLNSLAIA